MKTAMFFKFGREQHLAKGENSWASIPRNSDFQQVQYRAEESAI